MEYRLLGLSGCAVSALALGTLTFGNETSEADSFAQLDRFVSTSACRTSSAIRSRSTSTWLTHTN